jgi:hypothetical protein
MDTIEQNDMWIEQCLKGMIQGLAPPAKHMLFKLVLRASNMLAKTDWSKVESMNEAYMKGYEMAENIVVEMYRELNSYAKASV